MSELYIQLPDDFGERYEKYLNKALNAKEKPMVVPPQESIGKDIPVITYDPATGDGQVLGGRKFKFKYDGKEFKLFRELYKNINTVIKRYDVVIAIEIYEDGDKPIEAQRSLDTEKINRAVTKIREKTGLTPEQLSNNDGNLILRAKQG
ncbi:MAG: hypothetical protein JWN37_507 [Candidatus Nomurabacteria bacterium]|nr:hypothetical protein [Candidatus Nomurabacteria bacterium]